MIRKLVLLWLCVAGVAIAAPTLAQGSPDQKVMAPPHGIVQTVRVGPDGRSRSVTRSVDADQHSIVRAESDGHVVELTSRTGPRRVLIELRARPLLDRVVRGKGEVVAAQQDQLAQDLRAIDVRILSATPAQITRRYQLLFSGVAATVTPEAERQIRKLTYVSAVHEDTEVHATLNESVPLIGAPTIWSSYGVTGAGVKVAVIDTGIDYTHPDLGGCFGVGCRVVGGYDFVNKDGDPFDDFGHGTHVAGIIGANGTLKGVAPGVTLLAYKVLDSNGSGYSSDIIAALERAVTDGARIANLSLGGAGDLDDPTCKAVDNATAAGMLSVIAAGNTGPGYQTIGSPGMARTALTVGASNKTDEIASFSSRGYVTDGERFLMKPEVVAPGVAIRSTVPKLGSLGDPSGYASLSGTSMATPHVAGAAALLLQWNGARTPADVKARLVGSAVTLGQNPFMQGAGRIDLVAAFALPVLASVTHLDFGAITDATGVVSRQQTFSVRNVTAIAQSLSLTQGVPALPAGTTLAITPSDISLQPGQSADVSVQLRVDPGITPDANVDPLSYNTAVVISAGTVHTNVPAYFFKGPLLTLTMDEAPSFVWLMNPVLKTDKMFDYPQTPFSTLVPHGTWDVIVGFDGEPQAVVVREEQVVAGRVSLSVQSTEAVRSVTVNGVDDAQKALDVLMTTMIVALRNSDIPEHAEVALIQRSTSGRYRLSGLTSRYAVGVIGASTDWKQTRVFSYAWAGSGLSGDVELPVANQPMRRLLQKAAVPDGAALASLGYGTGYALRFSTWGFGHSYGLGSPWGALTTALYLQSTSSPGLPLILPTNSWIIGADTTFKQTDEIDGGYMRQVPGDLVQVDRTPWFDMFDASRAPDAVMKPGVERWDPDVRPNTLPLRFLNSSSALSANGRDQNVSLSWQSQTLGQLSMITGTRPTLDVYRDGFPVGTYRIDELRSPGVASPAGPHEVHSTSSYKIAGIIGTSRVVASFDTRNADPNPPFVSQFRLEQNDARTATPSSSGPATLIFEATDDTGLASVALDWRPTGASAWQPLILTRNGAEYSYVFQQEGAVDLRLTAADGFGNAFMEEWIPAFVAQSDTAPLVTTHPASQTVTAGSTASFTAGASGTPTPSVQWQVSTNSGATWSDISGATSTTYAIATAVADNGKQYRAVFTNSVGTATSNAATLTVNDSAVFTLVWSDEFGAAANAGLDTGQWRYDIGTSYPGGPPNWGTGEVETMSSSLANVHQDGSGHLVITPLHSGSSPTAGWTSGRIETDLSFAAPAGGVLAIEASIQQPNVNGAAAAGYWPAFWTLGEPFRGNYNNWPGIGEIDVMENINGLNSEFATLHCGTNPGGPCNEPTGLSSGQRACVGCQTAFHTYRMELDRSTSPEQIRWYLDGVHFFTVNASQVDPTTWANATSHGLFVILDLAIGGGFPAAFGGGPTATTASGVPMLVDYVRVYERPIASAAPTITTQPISQTVAAGQNASFTIGAGGIPFPTYQWQVSSNGGTSWTDLTSAAPYSGATSVNLTVASVSASLNGTQYSAVVTNSLGTATTNAATLTVNVVPSVTAHPANLTVTAGGTATFTAGASGTPTPLVQWQVSTNSGSTWSDSSGATSTTYAFTAAAADSGKQYRAVFTNSVGTATTNAASLSVNVAPVITTHPSNATVTAGSTASFTAGASGTPTPTVQWQLSTNGGSAWSDLSGATSTTHSFTAAATDSGKQYRAVFTNSVGTATTNAATLTVNVAPLVTTHPASQTATAGGTATFTAGASGTPTPTVQWQVSINGGSTWSDISGATATTYAFTAAVGDSGKQYRAMFTNSVSSVPSTAATLTVNAAPTASGVSITGTLAVGQVLTGHYTYGDVDGDAEGTSTFRWLRGGVAIANATALTYTTVAADSGPTLTFEVTPKAATGTIAGTPVPSSGVVIGNVAPTASGVSVTGTLAVGQVLTGHYTYGDVDGDAEGTSTFRWLRGGVAIAGATAPTYTTVAADSGQTLTFEVTPKAATGTTPGSAATNAGVTILNSASTLALTPSILRFAGTNANGTLSPITAPQTATVTFSNAAASAWSASADQPWVQITNETGAGSGTFTVGIINPGNVLGTATSASAVVTVTAADASNSPQRLAVELALRQASEHQAPFGVFDTPVHGATNLQGSFAVTGWALDDVGIDRVEIWRDPVAGETTTPYYGPGQPGHGKIFIAYPLFISNARPDVEALYPVYPLASRAGWGYLLLSWGLWNQGNATYKLYAFAFDVEGNSTSLGTKTITVDNAHANKPFGAIDTPGYGETKAGIFVNFGWALTPVGTSACRINSDGVQVGIDSGPLAAVTYGDARADIAAAFPSFLNSANASGAYYVDTTTLTNGRHQIGWLVTDNCGRQDGIGSRFFTVLNAGADAAVRTSSDSPTWEGRRNATTAGAASAAPVHVRQLGGDWESVEPNADGTRVIAVSQDGRIEVQLPQLGSGSYASYQDDKTGRGLPLGSSLDAKAGIFYWQPAAGFLGKYDLAFESAGAGDVRVRVVVGPPMRTVIDTPSSDEVVEQTFTLAGWALDLAAAKGTGLDTVHVWAYPLTGADPVFLGIAAYGDTRPDVGKMFGDSFAGSAYSLTVDSLPPGTYDVVVYPHRTKTNIFDGATVVRVTVK